MSTIIYNNMSESNDKYSQLLAYNLPSTKNSITNDYSPHLSIKLYVLPPSLNENFVLVGGLSTILNGLYLLANIIADTILICRCYKVWGTKKKIILFPVFISIINNGK
ncbi:hypothetical protein K435DRAFT_791511 [Dendrothele bispora CBS 962.96]|uniref:Uncharacterized protein n=1 Tax=Dendrothele bispora (strain CBS 962.96) TaxID=1314807 RepID=A0A4S8MM80_DENBC|nr:hypothetical protein K435DRAFT_791511 [Dendrothele bispora CBS 962.96]